MKNKMKSNPFENGTDERSLAIQFYIDDINDWLYSTDADSNFDPVFFESIEQQWTENGFLSDKQYNALKNIHEKWVNL